MRITRAGIASQEGHSRKNISGAQTGRIFGVQTYATASEDPETVNPCPGFLFSESKAWGDLHLDKTGESCHDT